ncbi:hypothetical protein jhhlp_000028 [Lomentospora prolificans]|uniref:Amidohydrolase-related domain-containing protein n=1 Tax=Lomentospora prolificans TaxID=41688 RepID=A0A2N3NLE9_9PEZI|nr:hypothetical protein jhhlp_000028 [Lomentospora prolificans]
MHPEKEGLLPTSTGAAVPLVAPNHFALKARRRNVRRSRVFRFVILSCILLIAYTQFEQLRSFRFWSQSSKLSVTRLQANLETCKKLHQKPQDPIGLGREKNDRFVDGTRPTLIRNASVWVGEPKEGTSKEDARAGKGYSWIKADVFVDRGIIQKVAAEISPSSLPEDTEVYDADGRQLTSGIIDMHSHAGVDSLPSVRGNEDTNEMSDDITPYVRSWDAIQPLDHQIQVIKSGGVTTSLVLPGSGNNMGGEAFLIKHAVGKHDGRSELSIEDMFADPDQNWRYMKMACGENAKRVYGKVGRGPFSRMGESWYFRHAFEEASKLVRDQDDWCAEAEAVGAENMPRYLPEELKWESLGAVLRGQVHVNTHCYTIPDLESFVDHTNEFKFSVRAFHHAHSTFLVPEILKRAWGHTPASALFADNMYYKAEAFVGSEYAGKILWDNGLDTIYVSDNPVLNAQHVVFEAAKGYRYGLPYHVALASVTTTPARYLGMGERLGKIKPGFDADIVVWDSDPLSVGATPVQVWIDGIAQFKDPVKLDKPVSDSITPDESLANIPKESVNYKDVVFTGVSKVWLSGHPSAFGRLNVIVQDGQLSCFGRCEAQMRTAAEAGVKVIDLKNGHLTDGFTAFGSLIGLNEIDMESDTDNGASGGKAFSRGIDGLALDSKKLHVAHRYGVTKAISAPRHSGGISRHGTGVGFRTGAKHALLDDAVWGDDVSVHYSLTLNAKTGDTPSISSAVGALRSKLLEAISSDDKVTDPYSEKAFLKKVVQGELPLILSAHSANTIAAVIRLKSDVEKAITESGSSETKLRIAILGGAESHIVAKELAQADVGVVLAPLLPYSTSWEERRSLTGAPLTNGTAVDALVDAGVVVAIGLYEDWVVRDLALHAGIAYRNGEGRLSEREALGLISTNVYKLLGIDEPKGAGTTDFVVFEGNPLEIDSRIKAVGLGGSVDVTE